MTIPSTAQLSPPVGERDHIVGPASAAITLVEYGDYECPYCGAAHPIVKEVRRRMGNGLRFAFRHFPLSRMHPHAERAAEAAEAAGGQGKFWQMHDMLYEHQDALEDDDLVAYAAAIGLDLERFGQDMLKGVHAARVHADFLSGVRSGVNGTPTFFINGYRHDGSYDFQTLIAAIASAALVTRA